MCLNVPIGVMHLINLLRRPNDLYEPIVIEAFDFKTKEYTRSFALKPKYSGIYEIGFFDQTGKIPSDFKFRGIVEIKLYNNSELIFSQIVNKADAYIYSKQNPKYLKKVILARFPLRITKRSEFQINIRLIESEEQMSQSLNIYVGISSIP